MNPQDIADAYIAVWNETDAARRAAMLGNGWAADVSFIDPLTKIGGREAVNDLIGSIQQRFPAHVFKVHGKPDGYNDIVRFSWSLSRDGADPVVIGTDMVTLDGEGRLKSVTGFLDQVAA